MKLFKSILSVAAAGVVTAGTVVAMSTPASAAPSLGSVRVSPANGNQDTGLSVATLDGQACPASASGTVLYFDGAGIAADQNIISGFLPRASSHSGGKISFVVENTFFSMFQQNNVTAPNGAYTLRLACIDSDFFTEVGEFTQTVNFTATGGSFNASYAAVVPAQGTSTTLSGSATSTYGTGVSLTASVSPNPGGGTVTFKEGATTLGTGTVNGSGLASFTTPANLGAGAHSITAEFGGNAGFNASTSAPHTLTVAKADTTTTLTSNGPTEEFAPATFTATVSPAGAGTVTFREGATTIGTGTVNGSGVAIFSTTTLSEGTHSITAEYVPSGGAAANVNGSTSAAHDHVVDASAAVSAAQPIIVEVPAGALTISIEGTVGGVVPVVDMGEAVFQPDGEWLKATGNLNNVVITDTRGGDPGWAATGVASPFVNGADSVSAFNLGWDPALVSKAANQDTLHVGDPVAGDKVVTGGTPAGVLGLGSAREFATTVPDHGNGTAILNGSLELWIPTDVPAGEYSATLTFTVI